MHPQSYKPPYFTDTHRLEKIQAIFPVIEKIYQQAAAQHAFPGYAFGVMLDGVLIHTNNAGYADIHTQTPFNSDTIFRIASVTKSLTAMAILQLRDAGKLQLDDPVYHYLPEIKNQRLTIDSPAITIRNLLTHSAGFPEDNAWGDRKLGETDQAFIHRLKNDIFLSNIPGITYEYSNLTFAILGYIINRVSGMNYDAYILQHICHPLDMQAFWEFTETPTQHLAHGYQIQNQHWKKEKLLPHGAFGAMGGMLTSIHAFSKYVALHQLAWPARDETDSGPLKRSSIREMHQPWTFNSLTPKHTYPDQHVGPLVSAYGYGLAWLCDDQNRIYVGHSGGLPGFGSNWYIIPDYGIGVILFANATYAPTSRVNLQVLETILDKAQLTPRQTSSVILNKRQAALIKFLPSWDGAERSDIFAENFFLDNSLENLKKQTTAIFNQAQQIIQIGDIVPENQLRGHFIIECQKNNIKIGFTLTPENPPLIQSYSIELLKNHAHDDD